MRTIFLGMDQAADQLRSGNTGDNPFKKKEVRQAFYQAIDIEAIKEKVMRGLSFTSWNNYISWCNRLHKGT